MAAPENLDIQLEDTKTTGGQCFLKEKLFKENTSNRKSFLRTEKTTIKREQKK